MRFCNQSLCTSCQRAGLCSENTPLDPSVRRKSRSVVSAFWRPSKINWRLVDVQVISHPVGTRPRRSGGFVRPMDQFGMHANSSGAIRLYSARQYRNPHLRPIPLDRRVPHALNQNAVACWSMRPPSTRTVVSWGGDGRRNQDRQNPSQLDLQEYTDFCFGLPRAHLEPAGKCCK